MNDVDFLVAVQRHGRKVGGAFSEFNGGGHENFTFA